MAFEVAKLNSRQDDILRWVADGCPYRDWPNEAHKITARTVASRAFHFN